MFFFLFPHNTHLATLNPIALLHVQNVMYTHTYTHRHSIASGRWSSRWLTTGGTIRDALAAWQNGTGTVGFTDTCQGTYLYQIYICDIFPHEIIANLINMPQ